MHKVIRTFADLQDNNHIYQIGDVFPRSGKEVTAERLAELSGYRNKQGVPLIEEVEEPKKAPTKRTKKASAE